MKTVAALITALCLTTLASCAMTGSNSRTGYAMINMQREAGEATGLPAGDKTGKACSQNILGVIAMGDSTLEAAMKDGGITKVSSVDYSYMQFIAVYGEVCTIVNGS
jgi:hypothetical protein